MEEPLDITKLRYVLYARKSTKDKERQMRSIPDQIKDCNLLADRLKLTVVGRPLKETGSAKTPGQRPIFDQMLNDIRAGKYDAILSWNPDRLARNMLEGGQIIQLIDDGILKDLQFKTHYFKNNANGKMLLGMAFVLSKQYSDDLQQKVTRGVRSRFQEGKTPTPKHGYVNEGGLYYPDDKDESKNFELICEAWQMRITGKSQKVIAKYMDKNSYGRKVKKNDRIIKIDDKKLSKVFQDSFYMGILVQAKQEIDLREIPGYDFVPAVTPEEFNQVQLLSKRRLTPYNTRRNLNFYPFKAIIRCAFCGSNMVVGPSTSGGKGKNVLLYYRCDNADCEWKKNKDIKPRNLRGKEIMKFLYDFFANDFNLTEKDYQRYYEKLGKLNETRTVTLKTKIRSLQGSLTALNEDIKSRSLKIVDLSLKGKAKEVNEQKITEEEAEKEELEREITKLKAQVKDPEQEVLSLEQFLNLVKKAEDIIKYADNVKKDAIVRLIFLNLFVNNEKVTEYRLKPPFDTMLKSLKGRSSRGWQTRTADLALPKRARYQLRQSPRCFQEVGLDTHVISFL